jgi:integrase
LRNKDASEHTYDNYLKAVHTLLKTRKDFVNPDDVIHKLQNNEVEIVDLFKRFIAFFAPEEWNGKWKVNKVTLRLWVAGIKKFLRANGIKVYAEDIKELMPRITKRRKKEAPSKEQLREVANYLSLRGKVILGLACGSGLRIGTIRTLQLKDIDLTQNPPMLKIPYSTIIDDKVVRKMKGATSDDRRVHITWMTPETKEWLQSYLAYRERHGEKLTPDSFVISYNFRGGAVSKVGKPLRYWMMWKELRQALKKAGFATKGRAELHPHIFRAYFRTMLTQAGVSEPDIECLMAHQGGYLQTEYYLPKIDHLKKEYESAIPFLSITSAGVERSILEKQAKEIENLKRQLEEKSLQIEKLTLMFLDQFKAFQLLKEELMKATTPKEKVEKVEQLQKLFQYLSEAQAKKLQTTN